MVPPMATPAWLSPPPIGLTDAERRVLEAFFVAEEVKTAAKLLSLSPKTVQNELLLARQTMDEAKSWTAAIRYVFHAKRHGLSFVSIDLESKINRQVRRLIDDYLEFEETQQVRRASKLSTDLARHDQPPPNDQPLEVATDLAPIGTTSEEQFEAQLIKLTTVAALVYERTLQRRRRQLLSVLGATLLLGALTWGLANVNSTPRSLEQYNSAITNAISTNDMRESGRLLDKLCEDFWQEMWGEKEVLVVAVMKAHESEISQTIDWAMSNDKRLALRILANGHRGFVQTGNLKTKWFPLLLTCVEDSEDTSAVMVRALCGIILGTLDEGVRTGGNLDPRFAERTRSMAVDRLRTIMDKQSDPCDYANALRHVAMTQNNINAERIANCRRAIAIYEQEGGDMAQRGIGQCLLSIAQSAGLTPIEHIQLTLDAYSVIKPLKNDVVIRECLKGLKENARNALKQLKDSRISESQKVSWQATLQRARTELRTYAAEGAGINDLAVQFDHLFTCYEIDNEVDPSKIGEDLQALVLCRHTTGLNRETRDRLAGFAFARLKALNVQPDRLLVAMSSDRPGSDARFAEGQRWTPAEAFEAALNWKPVEGRLD